MRIYPSEEPNAKKDKNYVKAFNKVVGEGAEEIVHLAGVRSETASELEQSLHGLFDEILCDLIRKSRMHF
jgi:hypothetical protein